MRKKIITQTHSLLCCGKQVPHPDADQKPAIFPLTQQMPPTFLELLPCLAQLATETAADEENFAFALQKQQHPTCHDGADEEEDAEEDVPRQRAESIDDLPLADGEDDSEHLRRIKKWMVTKTAKPKPRSCIHARR